MSVVDAFNCVTNNIVFINLMFASPGPNNKESDDESDGKEADDGDGNDEEDSEESEESDDGNGPANDSAAEGLMTDDGTGGAADQLGSSKTSKSAVFCDCGPCETLQKYGE